MFTNNPLPDTNTLNNRGQLLLVAAVIIAIAFVGLVIVLNSVLLAQNIDSRGISPEIDSSERGVEAIKSSYGDGMDRINADREDTSDTDMVEIVNTGSTISGEISIQERGEIEVQDEITASDVQTGQYISNDDPTSDFTSESGDANWILADGTNEYRQGDFRFDVDNLPGSSNPVRIVIHNDNTNEAQIVNVYQQTGNAHVEIENAEVNSSAGFTGTIQGGEPFETIGTSDLVYVNDDDILKIDVTQGTIQGSDVFNFGFEYDETADYGIAIENGDAATGVFRLTTGDDSAARSTNLETNPDDDGGSQPYVVDGIYSFEVTYTYSTGEYQIRDTVTVKPNSIESSSSTNSPIYQGVEPANPDQTFEFTLSAND